MVADVMIAIAILLGLATLWLLWSSIQTNKKIKVAFENVEKDAMFPSGICFSDVVEYCDRNNIGYEHICDPDFLVVEYGEIDVIVEQEGDLKLGNTFFSLRG